MVNHILLAHGSGGTVMRELIGAIFVRQFANPALEAMGDSAIIDIPRQRLAFTTDSFVVKPLLFPGGDIGKLAVCGTVNDLAAAGARPRYLSASFIIEEGFEIALLERIAVSMAESAREAGVAIVAGDTKVVEHGACDGLFITTAGVGELLVEEPLAPSRIRPGDMILINGPIADHGIAIMASREGLTLQTEIQSDCAPLHGLAQALIAAVPALPFLRDATRGGLAAVLHEAASGQPFGISVEEEAIPLREGTAAACELMGLDPLHVANEGKLVAFVPAPAAAAALAAIRSHPLGRGGSIIGLTTAEDAGRVNLTTRIGTRRLVIPLSGEQLPRIC